MYSRIIVDFISAKLLAIASDFVVDVFGGFDTVEKINTASVGK